MPTVGTGVLWHELPGQQQPWQTPHQKQMEERYATGRLAKEAVVQYYQENLTPEAVLSAEIEKHRDSQSQQQQQHQSNDNKSNGGGPFSQQEGNAKRPIRGKGKRRSTFAVSEQVTPMWTVNEVLRCFGCQTVSTRDVLTAMKQYEHTYREQATAAAGTKKGTKKPAEQKKPKEEEDEEAEEERSEEESDASESSDTTTGDDDDDDDDDVESNQTTSATRPATKATTTPSSQRFTSLRRMHRIHAQNDLKAELQEETTVRKAKKERPDSSVDDTNSNKKPKKAKKGVKKSRQRAKQRPQKQEQKREEGEDEQKEESNVISSNPTVMILCGIFERAGLRVAQLRRRDMIRRAAKIPAAEVAENGKAFVLVDVEQPAFVALVPLAPYLDLVGGRQHINNKSLNVDEDATSISSRRNLLAPHMRFLCPVTDPLPFKRIVRVVKQVTTNEVVVLMLSNPLLDALQHHMFAAQQQQQQQTATGILGSNGGVADPRTDDVLTAAARKFVQQRHDQEAEAEESAISEDLLRQAGDNPFHLLPTVTSQRRHRRSMKVKYPWYHRLLGQKGRPALNTAVRAITQTRQREEEEEEEPHFY